MKTANQTKIKTMRLSNEIIDKIEKMAQEENRNFTNMVETLLKKATSTTLSV